MIVWLESDSATDPTRTGGKFSNLAKLVRSGVRVPPAFCVEVDAFDGIIRQAGHSVAGEAIPTDPDVFQKLSAELVGLIDSQSLPEALIEELGPAVERLAEPGGREVAIRSSALVEDLSDTSFAGQFDSFLRVPASTDAVIANIKKCWASAFSPRALSYAAKNGIPVEHLRMAVIVQRMSKATVSGITFTVDPTEFTGEHMLIEAVAGTGEDLASGIRTPRSTTLPRHQVSNDHGPGPPGKQQPQETAPDDFWSSLPLAEIARTCMNIENAFGSPQDIEWSLEEDRLMILQSRPITTQIATRQIPSGVWSRAITEDLWPEPMTPLTASVVSGPLSKYYTFSKQLTKLGLTHLASAKMTTVVEGYLYLNCIPLKDVIQLIPVGMRSEEIGALIPDEILAGIPKPSLMKQLSVLARLPRLLLTDRLAWALSNPRKVRALSSRFEDRFAELDRELEQAKTPEEILSNLDQAIGVACEIEDSNQWSYGFAYGFTLFLQHLFAKWCGSDLLPSSLVPLEKTVAGEAVAMLEELAKHGDQQETADAPSQSPKSVTMEDFLRRFGARSACRDLSAVRWREDPSIVESMLLSIRETQKRFPATEKSNQKDEQRKTSDARQLGLPRRTILSWLMRHAKVFLSLREELRLRLDEMLARIRLAALKLGQELAKEGVLTEPEDVFFLDLDELRGAVRDHHSMSDMVLNRRTRFEAASKLFPPYFLIEGRAAGHIKTDKDALLSGVGASPGVATGSAYIVRQFEDLFKLEDGCVLIATAADPGWTPFFRRASAIVTEAGGMLSHCSVVARELGIPTVVGAARATTMINDGDVLSVDGNRGVVTRVDQ
jgi:pyruvate,water dikinase